MTQMSANRKTPRSIFAVFRCSPEERENLKRVAKEQGVSVSEVIRKRLKRDLKKAA